MVLLHLHHSKLTKADSSDYDSSDYENDFNYSNLNESNENNQSVDEFNESSYSDDPLNKTKQNKVAVDEVQPNNYFENLDNVNDLNIISELNKSKICDESQGSINLDESLVSKEIDYLQDSRKVISDISFSQQPPQIPSSIYRYYPENEADDDNSNWSGSINVSSKCTYTSCSQYYAYKLMREENSYIHYFGRLYQQFIVDCFIKCENNRLQFIKKNQARLRVELYKGMVDAYNQLEAKLGTTGKLIVVPANFVGGPRYLLNLFQDAIIFI